MKYEVYNHVTGTIHSLWDFKVTAKKIAKSANLKKDGNLKKACNVTFKVREV